MDTNSNLVHKAIKKYLNCEMSELSLLGSGANGNVYYCKVSEFPYTLALKVTDYAEMLQKEGKK